MFEIVRTKIIRCAFKIKKKYIDVSRLQPLHNQRKIAFNFKTILPNNRSQNQLENYTGDQDYRTCLNPAGVEAPHRLSRHHRG